MTASLVGSIFWSTRGVSPMSNPRSIFSIEHSKRGGGQWAFRMERLTTCVTDRPCGESRWYGRIFKISIQIFSYLSTTTTNDDIIIATKTTELDKKVMIPRTNKPSKHRMKSFSCVYPFVLEEEDSLGPLIFFRIQKWRQVIDRCQALSRKRRPCGEHRTFTLIKPSSLCSQFWESVLRLLFPASALLEAQEDREERKGWWRQRSREHMRESTSSTTGQFENGRRDYYLY